MPLMTRGLGEDPFKTLQGALFNKMRQQQQEKKANEMMNQQNQSMHDIISQEVNNFNGRDEKVKDSVNENLKGQGINGTVDNVNTSAVQNDDGELKDVKQPISNTPDETINNRVKDNVENEHDGVKLDNVNTKPIREHVDEYGPDYDYTVNGDGYERDKHGTQEIKGDSPITQNSDDKEQEKEANDDAPGEEKTDSSSEPGETDSSKETDTSDEKDDTAPIDRMPVGQTNDTDNATASPQNASKRGKYKVKEWQ